MHANDIKARIQEHTIMVLSVIKHGIEVFGTLKILQPGCKVKIFTSTKSNL
jgi:hypothetical protein